MSAAVRTLLLMGASGSALGAALMLARRVFGKKLPSALWYYAWLPVLLRLILPLPGLIPTEKAEDASAAEPVFVQAEQTESRAYRYENPVNYVISEGEEAAASYNPAEEALPVSDAQSAETPAVRRTAGADILKTPGFWLALWLSGAALCFARYAAGYVRFKKTLTRTMETPDGTAARVYASFDIPGKPKLFRCRYARTPMLLGLFRPLIVLPDAPISEEQAENILRHELTHFRRGDVLIKWLAVLASSLHWFNPLMPLFRRELDRVCELSCDERVLLRMTKTERQSYGETLLDLAGSRALPAGVVATTFATEKRDLKERLEHIMKFKYKSRAIIALTIAAVLLMGTAALAAGPARKTAASADSPNPTPEAANSIPGFSELDTVEVSTVDELLAAIRPGVCAVLAPGTYNLSAASDYGKPTDSEYYRWEEVNDGYELVIESVTHMAITASSDDPTATVISAVPRYADVLAFTDCLDIRLSGFTAGHTVEQGACMGGVIHLMGSEAVTIDDCALYGCGVLGVDAENCRNILVSDSDIYECSNGAVELTSCQNVQFDGCEFRDCYNRWDGGTSQAMNVFSIASCYGVAITDGHVYGNNAMELVHVNYSQQVFLLGTLFEDNTATREEYLPYSGTVFNVSGDPIMVAGCEFRDDIDIYAVSETSPAADLDGNALTNDDLAAMKQEHIGFVGFVPMPTVELDRQQGKDGIYEVHVSTVDEFLAAIAPDTTVYLDEGLYDLSTAMNYGSYGSQYYYWIDLFDGPGLVITGVENLSIVGADKDSTRIEALPRYADVIRFDDCKNVSVQGVTAGHTLGAGSCSGAVLDFWGCEGVDVRGCGLFGCGTYGVVALDSADITVEDNEIYECSYGAVQLSRCAHAAFAENDIHDCAYPTYGIYESLNVTIDGEAVAEEAFDSFMGSIYAEEAQLSGSTVLSELIDSGRSTGNASIDIPGAGPYKSAQ